MGINCNYQQCRVIDMKNQPLRIVSESNLSKTLQFIPAHYNYPSFVKKIRNRQALFPLLLALMNEPPPPLLHRFASEITKNHNHQVAAWKTWANKDTDGQNDNILSETSLLIYPNRQHLQHHQCHLVITSESSRGGWEILVV